MDIDDPLLSAAIYEAIHRGTPGDVAFYRRVCGGATRVLELGCGTGRIARALAASGARVLGIEIDAARAALAQRNVGRRGCADAAGSVSVLNADATRLPLAYARAFDRVVIAYNTLCALDSDDAVIAVLEAVAARLRPGGELYLDVYVVDEQVNDGVHVPARSGASDYCDLCTLVFGGLRVRVLEQELYGADARRIELRYRYEVASAQRVRRTIEERISHLMLPPLHLEALLEHAGFVVSARVGDFSGPLRADSEQLVLCARLSGATP